VCGVAGSAATPRAVHQAVNNRQSAAYARSVAGARAASAYARARSSGCSQADATASAVAIASVTLSRDS